MSKYCKTQGLTWSLLANSKSCLVVQAAPDPLASEQRLYTLLQSAKHVEVALYLCTQASHINASHVADLMNEEGKEGMMECHSFSEYVYFVWGNSS